MAEYDPGEITPEMEADQARYLAALHAMQTGVAYQHAKDDSDATQKQLRVGINSALVNDAALVQMLVERGVFTHGEYVKAMADAMETERDRYLRIVRDLYHNDNIALA